MIIAVPIVDVLSKKNIIAPSLSVLGCMCIYNTDSKSAQHLRVLDMEDNMNDLFKSFKRNSVSAIIASVVHPMAVKVLENQKIEIYKSIGDDLNYNLGLFEKKQLERYDYATSLASVNLCGTNCGVCTSDCDSKMED